MKKTILSFLLLSSLAVSSIFAKSKTSEYKVELNDKITIQVRESFECTGTIAHLAGFEEYNYQDRQEVYKTYDEYFKKYENDDRVVKAISYFNTIRQNGFGYDAVAEVSAYLTSDCHTFRTSEKVVAKNFQKRNGSPAKIKKVIADFYDATDFDNFYKSQLKVYEQSVQYLVDNKDEIIRCVDEYEKYFKSSTNHITISVSPLNAGNNYGVSFNDGKKIYLEPFYTSGYFDKGLLIHEMAHPMTHILADELVKNKEIMNLLNKVFTGEKKEIMNQQAYGNPETYINELFNRANTINVLRNFCAQPYIHMSIMNDKNARFDEIEEVANLFENYRTGNYNNQLEYLPELEKGYIELLKIIYSDFTNGNQKNKFELSPDETSSFTFFDNTYEAEYCGIQDLTGFSNFVCRKYWRLKDAYKDVSDLDTYGYLPYNNYVFEVHPGEVYRIEYLYDDGTGFFNYLRADENDFYEEELITRVFYLE